LHRTPAGASSYTCDGNGNTAQAGTLASTWNAFTPMTSHTSAGGTTPQRLPRHHSANQLGSATSFIRDPDGTLISSAGASI
jgi:hypothetical protein